MRALKYFAFWFGITGLLSSAMAVAERAGISLSHVLCVEVGVAIVMMVWLLVLGHQNRRGIEENGRQLQAQLVQLSVAEAKAQAWMQQYEVFREAFSEAAPRHRVARRPPSPRGRVMTLGEALFFAVLLWLLFKDSSPRRPPFHDYLP